MIPYEVYKGIRERIMNDVDIEQLQALLADIDVADLIMVSDMLGVDIDVLIEMMEVEK